MNQNKRKTSFVVIGVILIIVGIIMFIISAVQLYDVQTTTTHWAEGFMQDYQARTNATNSIPCYMFMFLAVIMVIAGIIMLCIKPRANIVIAQNPYNTANLQSTSYCPNCNNKVDLNDKFCKNCSYNLKQINQNVISEIVCSNCGQANKQGSQFCVKCGTRLT
ncbi:MAG: zinc ribbon domain-containing protein [Ruminococcus sp.]